MILEAGRGTKHPGSGNLQLRGPREERSLVAPGPKSWGPTAGKSCHQKYQLEGVSWSQPCRRVSKVHPCCSMQCSLICFYCQVLSHCAQNTFHLSIHQLVGIWVTSAFWLLWIILLWTFVFKLLCGHMFLFILGIHSGIIGLHGNPMFNFLRNS